MRVLRRCGARMRSCSGEWRIGNSRRRGTTTVDIAVSHAPVIFHFQQQQQQQQLEQRNKTFSLISWSSALMLRLSANGSGSREEGAEEARRGMVGGTGAQWRFGKTPGRRRRICDEAGFNWQAAHVTRLIMLRATVSVRLSRRLVVSLAIQLAVSRANRLPIGADCRRRL